jgi:intein/homing endonuclease
MSTQINNSKQYEANQLTKENKKELLRALFDSYKSRVVSGLGFSTLETVMNDRLMSFKNITKKELEKCFFTTFFFLILGFIAFINMIELSIYFFFLLAFFTGFMVSNIRTFLLKNISPINDDMQKIAFKKVIYDVYFETITSVQLIYYVFIFFIVALFVLLHYFTTVETFYYVDLTIFKLAYKLNLISFNFYYFLNDILISFFVYLVGSYTYLYIYIRMEIKTLMNRGKNKNDN